MPSSTLAEAKLESLRRLRELQAELKRLKDIDDGAVKRPWREIARPEQIAPPGTWMTWLILAGRGWGKSRTAAEWAAERGRRYPGSRIALVGKTFADARDTMIEGESGLLACFSRDEFKNHSEDDGYNRSISEIRLHNGTHYKAYSAEKPWRLRGPQHHACFPAGTKVRVPGGTKLIQDVAVGDYVMTRVGPRRVTWMISRDSTLMTVRHQRGSLTGTPDHPVMTARGWVEITSLHSGDILSTWENSYDSRINECHQKRWMNITSDGIRILAAIGTESTASTLTREIAVRSGGIASTGLERMGSFQPVTSSTIGITFPAMTGLETSPHSPPVNTRFSMQACASQRCASCVAMNLSVPFLDLLRGSAQYARNRVEKQADCLPCENASFARMFSQLGLHQMVDLTNDIAADHAQTWPVESAGRLKDEPVLSPSAIRVLNAEITSPAVLETGNSAVLAAPTEHGIARVYNIQVDGQPEYFADDVLVHNCWCDEAAFWQDASKGLVADTTWSNLVITLRLPKMAAWDDEYQPQIVVATTPRPVALLRTTDPDPARSGLMQRETTIITRGRTMDNIANLSDQYKDNVIAPLMGTRLGRQELDAEILEDMPGALWRREWIDSNRVTDPSLVPDLIRVVVGVDPSVTDGESSAQTGIVVAGAAKNGRGYILGDFTLRGSPMETMSKAISVFHQFNADRIVAEANNGGDYIRTLIQTIDPNIPFQAVHATRGKAIRAEPISSLYEQNRVSHVGVFSRLEDEMCSWLPTDPVSPDMMDACLSGDTMVLAERGEVPIQDIIPGERVWTRQGWRKVLASRCTQRDAEVMTVHLSDGREITGTPDHRILVEGKSWVRLDALVCGDKLATWTHQIHTQSSFSSTVRPTGETRVHLIDSTASTTSKTRQIGQAQACSTVMCGNSSMTVKSSTGATSITETSTLSTMSLATCACSHRHSTLRPTSLTQPDTSSFSGSLKSAESTRQNGIAAKKDMSGIVSMLFASGERTAQPSLSSARDVAVHLSQSHTSSSTAADSAQWNAAALSTQMSINFKSYSPVKSAEKTTGTLGMKTREDARQHALACAHTDTEVISAPSSYHARYAAPSSVSESVITTECTRALECAAMSCEAIPAVKQSNAQYAGLNSRVTSKNAITNEPAHVSVVGSSVSKKRQPVYDLMVDEVHEFLANGVIVHNCVWAMWALRDLIGGSFLAAYGVIKCEKCQHPFTAADPSTKQPRTSCPKCAAPVELSD
jgi:phage terminase large subunit-like protein